MRFEIIDQTGRDFCQRFFWTKKLDERQFALSPNIFT